MFREMRRFKQQISEEECIQILKEQPRGVLSMLGDDDYPYGIPLDHWYCEENGRLYFHCAKTGHKLDAIRKHDKVSFCVYDEGFRREGDWALNIRSVGSRCTRQIMKASRHVFLFLVFFQSPVVFINDFRCLNPNITDMPRLICVTGH